MEMERQIQRAVKSIPNGRSAASMSDHNREMGNKLPESGKTNDNGETDDDEIVILDDEMSDAVREDLERALRPTVSSTSAISRPERGFDVQETPAAAPGPSASTIVVKPKPIIDNVRNITRIEYERLKINAKRLAANFKPATPMSAGQDGNSSDSDLEIVEERISQPKIDDSAARLVAEGTATIKRVALKVLPTSAAPLIPGLKVLKRSPLRSGPVIPAGRGQVLTAVSLPQPPSLQRQPIFLQRPPVPIRPASALETPLAMNRMRTSLQRPPNLCQRPSLLYQQPAAGGTSSFIAPRVLSPQHFISPSTSSYVRPIFHPAMGATRPVDQPRCVLPSRPLVNAASILRPAPARGSEEPLPVFGRNYTSINRHINGGVTPVVRHTVASNQQLAQRSDRRRRRAASPSSSSSTSLSSSFAASASSSNDSENARGTKPRRVFAATSTPEREKKMSTVRNLPSVKFPDAYYGRIRIISRRSLQSESETFDGLFQCNLCKDICISNVSFVSHLYAHILHPAVEDEALKSQTRCVTCWRQFDDLFKLTNHCDEVHGPQSSSVCYICELSFENDLVLRNHMNKDHPYGHEMPYNCKICKYRSSLYEDVWNHFAVEHKKTLVLMCPLCLLIVEASFIQNKYDSNLTTARTDAFAGHIDKHIQVMDEFSCDRCKLQFVSASDLRKHLSANHRQLRPAEINASRHSSGLLALDWEGSRPLTEIEADGKCLEMRRLQTQTTESPRFTVTEADCIECGQPMNISKHYSKKLHKCDLCGFSTYCIPATACHKAVVHRDANLPALPFEYSRSPQYWPVVLQNAIQCNCGRTEIFGNKMASHVESCPEAGGQVDLKQLAERPSQRKQRPRKLMSVAMMASLKILPKVPFDLDDQRQDGQERFGGLESESSVLSRLDVIPQTSMEIGSLLPVDTAEKEESSTLLSLETLSHDLSPQRPRLLSPQVGKTRFSSQGSVADDEAALSQNQAKRSRKRSPSPIRPSALESRLIAKYQEWSHRSELLEAAIKGANNIAQKMINRTEGKSGQEENYNLISKTELPLMEQMDGPDNTRKEITKVKKKKRKY